jgi:hypothetical protein
MNTRVKKTASPTLALAVFSSGFAFTFVVLMATENMRALVMAASAYVIAVILAQLLIVKIAGALLGRTVAGTLLAAGFGGANAYALYIVHMNLHPGHALLYTFAITVGFAVTMIATSERPKMRLLTAAMLAALPMMSLLENVSITAPFPRSNQPNQALLDSYAKIRLRETPNIYMISLDALIPLPAAQKLLNVDALPYDEKLRALGATVFDNAFATDTPSIESHDAIMLLDDHWHFKDEGYFAGRLASPVSKIFRANGYHVETGSSVPLYFGTVGPEIDSHLYIAKNFIRDSSLCKFASASVRQYGAFGFCRFDGYFKTRFIFDLDVLVNNPSAAYFDSEWHKAVVERITDIDPKQPRLQFFYYYYPIGHAPNDFITFNEAQLAAYRNRFKIQAEKAAELIEELFELIGRVDPGAIVMVFGDHGVKISRTADWQTQTELWVQDNHAVALALWGPQNACAVPEMPAPYSGDGYVTLGRTLAAVVRCLAENPEDLDAIVRFIDKFDFSKYLFR